MNQEAKKRFASATHFALASSGPEGLNVVPVSVVELVGDEIQIAHFFMNKTMQNVRANPQVALTAWQGLQGIQIKGAVRIIEDGEEFVAVETGLKERFPDRTLRAVLKLTPSEVYSVTPGEEGRVMT